MNNKIWKIFLILFLFKIEIYCQDTIQNIQEKTLNEISLSSYPLQKDYLTSAISISVVEKQSLLNQNNNSANEALYYVPGLFLNNSYNPAQGVRIASRGFGARASFGITGLKILIDELPESTPDGTGNLDNLPLRTIEKVEVLKGSSSALYGNASGGVISFITELPKKNLELEISNQLGSFNSYQQFFKLGQRNNKSSYLFQFTNNKSDGYRQQSANNYQLLNFKSQYYLDNNNKHELNTIVNIKISQFQDPSGVTLKQADTNRTSAYSEAIKYNIGEKGYQFKTGLIYNFIINENTKLNAKIYYLRRQVNNILPFISNASTGIGGAGFLDRNFIGQSINFVKKFKYQNQQFNFQIGNQNEIQIDERKNYLNKIGFTDTLNKNQIEQFLNIAFNFNLNYILINKLFLDFAIRYDNFKLTLNDLIDKKNNTEINFNNISPLIGISFLINKNNSVFANYRYSFETPSLQGYAVATKPGLGWNTSIMPQKNYNYELGFRGNFKSFLNYDIVGFIIQSTDEIVSYSTDNGSKANRNAGKVDKQGLESSIKVNFLKYFETQINYTFSNFIYKEYIVDGTNYSNNKLPGIPQNNTMAELRYFLKEKFYIALQGIYYDNIYVDDANNPLYKTKETFILNARSSYEYKFKNGIYVKLYGGINNILNTIYYSNLRINAAIVQTFAATATTPAKYAASSHRFYEPAPLQNFYLGISFGL